MRSADTSSAVRISGSNSASARVSSARGTLIDCGATPSNSFASAIKSLSVPFFTRAKIGSTNFIASATSSAARGMMFVYPALDRR